MCAGKTHLASSQRQGSQSLASAAALPSKAASPTGPQHVEPEPLLPQRVISTGCLSSGGRAAALWPAGRRPCAVPRARVPTGAASPRTGARSRLLAWAVGCSTRSSAAETGAGEARREQPGGAGGSSHFKVAFVPKIQCGSSRKHQFLEQVPKYISFALPLCSCAEKDGLEEDHGWDFLFLFTKLLLKTFQVA